MTSRAARQRRRGGLGKGFLKVFLIIIVCAIAGVVIGISLTHAWLQDLPDYEDSSAYNTAQKTQIFANDRKTLLAEFFVENREPVGWDGVSQFVKEGTVATEDERFYQHGAYDPIGIARAVYVRLTRQGHEGASTITQQFVRNTILLDEMHDITLKRKVREIYLAGKIEERYSKDDILLMYLNTINYGSGAYGIEAASHLYFSKTAKDLSLVEAATLVGIPQSPNANNPLEHPEACQARRDIVLSRMLTNGYISQEEYDEAVATNVSDYLKPTKFESGDGIYRYPYFSTYVRDVLLEKYDKNEVFKSGMKVYTTLDIHTQEAAELAAKRKEASIPEEYEVALTAVDPETGFIKAMVGGKNFNKDQFNLATQAKRQPGSSFKTFTLISAIEQGIDPNTIIDCSSPVKIGNWKVENYHGADYGMRTITGAFAISSNTAFARLIDYVKPATVVDVAKRMGIESELQAVPSITLGTELVTTKEMAQAYATIANGGIAREATPIEEIVAHNGRTMYKAETEGKRVLSPEVAYAATETMKSVVQYGTGREAALRNGQPVAGKTGTTENNRDSYFCGITPQLSVAVWLGARQEKTMPDYIKSTSVFSDFMNQILYGQQPKPFPKAKYPRYKKGEAYPFSKPSANKKKFVGEEEKDSKNNNKNDSEKIENQDAQSSEGEESHGPGNSENTKPDKQPEDNSNQEDGNNPPEDKE